LSTLQKGEFMPQGSKAKYTSKQKRMAKHIEDSEKSSGKSSERSKQIAYATVNKEHHGGKKSGSGRGKTESHASSRKGGKIGASKVSHLAHVRAGKKAAKTRREHSHNKAA
jgi:hypothetical protein